MIARKMSGNTAQGLSHSVTVRQDLPAWVQTCRNAMLHVYMISVLLVALAASNAAASGAESPDPGPQDPPFDLTRVLFSGTFSDHGVLQRAPRKASVYGTAHPGGTVTVTLTGPDGYKFTSSPAQVVVSSDPQLHGTWRTLLPPRPAGFG